ncbi:phosphoribosylglycinamide formyltransferase [Tautonia plasticadhaerens]|uniref:Phosphoribosylglycinamide formyltransferase n=1 Tax=Tautonia plasticadhaerens TaxID=2527974 RepID=A0A518GXK2_9BACT|nr:phosphoribosylglycinamide formyltransferase [Tautonia plasticadhaerens]QDV33293.1 Phosphoribosylglycinamide formyltransferase [Tautonia plasticadhaerens]
MPESPRTPPIADPPIRLAVLASGGGTTLQNLIDRIGDGRLVASIARVVVSKPGVAAIERAERAGIPVGVVRKAGLAPEAYEAAVFDPIRQAGADLVVLAGFLSLLPIPEDYLGKIINVHPSLLPSFGGRGFHGEAVHRAALEVGVKVSGCTVHFVDERYDNGPIILQRTVPVLDDDTEATLASRVQAAERSALPEAIALYADGRLLVEGRRVRVLDPYRE